MHAERTKKAAKASREEVQVSFSPQVRAAFADLAAAVHFSEHFDADIRSVLNVWVKDKALNAQDVLQAFPAIAEETFRHIQATGDERATEAWSEIRNQMGEQEFTLSTSPAHRR